MLCPNVCTYLVKNQHLLRKINVTMLFIIEVNTMVIYVIHS